MNDNSYELVEQYLKTYLITEPYLSDYKNVIQYYLNNNYDISSIIKIILEKMSNKYWYNILEKKEKYLTLSDLTLLLNTNSGSNISNKIKINKYKEKLDIINNTINDNLITCIKKIKRDKDSGGAISDQKYTSPHLSPSTMLDLTQLPYYDREINLNQYSDLFNIINKWIEKRKVLVYYDMIFAMNSTTMDEILKNDFFSTSYN